MSIVEIKFDSVPSLGNLPNFGISLQLYPCAQLPFLESLTHVVRKLICHYIEYFPFVEICNDMTDD